MFNRKLKEENIRLTEQLFNIDKDFRCQTKTIFEKNTLIKHLKQEILDIKNKYREKGYKIDSLRKTIRRLESWLPSLIGMSCSVTVKSRYDGLSVSVSPPSYSEVKFPKMTFPRYQNQRDSISVALGSNPVLNDIFGKQLCNVFDKKGDVKIHDDSITVYCGIKSVSKIVEVYAESLKKYDKFISV